jgi:NADH-quinone oxidoreductase subunit L
MTHAFFKSLLFLAAGIVIKALHDEHDIFRMGGLRQRLPVAFWTFLAGACALAGLPLITSGAYSKDLILWRTWSSPVGNSALWTVGIAGVVLTSLYTFRVVFLVFFGPMQTQIAHPTGLAMRLPVCILAVLTVVGGFAERFVTQFLGTDLPAATEIPHGIINETSSAIVAALAFIAGLLLAWQFYLRPAVREPRSTAIQRFWQAGWGFDWFYDRIFVRPVVWIANINKDDIVDSFYRGLAAVSQLAYRSMSRTQTGRLRWYAAGIAAGTALFIAVAIFR